jgi:predicted RNA polymerase sigma factor
MRALGDIHAAIEDALGRLEREGAGTGIEERVAALVAESLRPDPSPATDPRRRTAAPTAAGPAEQVRDLLYACVHPTIPVDRQLNMLLRFGFWLPNDAAARVLQIDPSTVGIHLRQSCRRLRAVTRRGGRGCAGGGDSRSLGVLKLLDWLRRRGLELEGLSPRVAEALGTDTREFVVQLLESETAVAKGEAHAFLADLYLGTERARRSAPVDDPAHPLRVRAEPAEDAVRKGLRHLKAAQELGARDRFVWVARIHAAYLLSPDRTNIDWEQMVGLYEGLLRVSAHDAVDLVDVGSSSAA